jgi:hypothetical protein
MTEERNKTGILSAKEKGSTVKDKEEILKEV